MRILIVTQYFWPEDFRINDLAARLHGRGHQVTVLTGMPNYPGGKIFEGYGYFRRQNENRHGVEIVRVPLAPRGRGGGFRLAVNYLSFALSAMLLGPFRCRGRFDIVFVYEPSPVTVGLPALVMKWVKSAPLVFWVQDLWPESLSATGAVSSPLVLNLVGKLAYLIYRGTNLVLVQSRAFVKSIADMGIGEEKIRYFPNSAEDLYCGEAKTCAPAEIENLPAGFRVMFAGNIGAAQDFETILKAAELTAGHPEIHWVVLGDGRMYEWVSSQVRERGLAKNFHLLGRHPVETMPACFAAADAMLVTLRRDPIFALTIPSKVQSYLACGKPIVAALDGEGARVVRESQAGLACPAEDAQALADSVLAMYRMDRQKREDMGWQGRAYFDLNFESSMLVEQLERWMAELSGGEASRLRMRKSGK